MATQPITNDVLTPIGVATNTVSTTPPPVIVPKKNKKKGCIIVAIIALLLLCCVVLIGIFAVINIYHIPGVSVYTENAVLSPGEQLNKRLNLYTDLASTSIETKDSNSGLSALGQSQADRAKKIMAEMGKMGMDIKLKYIITDPDLSSKENNVELAMHIDLDQTDPKSILGQGDVNVLVDMGELISGNVALDFAVDTENVYLQLNEDSTVPDMDLSSLVNTWYSIPIEEAEDFNEFTSTKESDTTAIRTAEEIENIQKFQKIINHDIILNNTTIVNGEKVGNQPTKCYMVSLNKNEMIELAKYTSEIYDEKYDETVYKELDKSSLTICFGKRDSIPYSIKFTAEGTEDTNTIAMEMSVSYYPAPEISIEIPKNHTNYKDMDMSSLMGYSDDDDYTYNYDDDDDYSISNYKTCTFAPESAGCASCELFGETEDTCAYCEQMYTDFSYITEPEERFDNYCTDIIE